MKKQVIAFAICCSLTTVFFSPLSSTASAANRATPSDPSAVKTGVVSTPVTSAPPVSSVPTIGTPTTSAPVTSMAQDPTIASYCSNPVAVEVLKNLVGNVCPNS